MPMRRQYFMPYRTDLTSTPQFTPGSGSYGSAQTVVITCATPSSTIYYTTDGTMPTTSSTVYTGPLTVSSNETIQAIATAAGFATSQVGRAVYTITSAAATPTFSPGTGTYGSAQNVVISSTTTGASIYYTTDGTTPTYPISGTTQAYTGPVAVGNNETLQAIAVATGYTNSAASSATYTFSLYFVTTSPLPNATSGTAYSKQIVVAGGTPPYSYSLSATTGTNTWSINATTGTVTGTPSNTESDTFLITVNDSASSSIQQTFAITVVAAGSVLNPIAVNFAAGGTGDTYYEGFPIFKNRIRESGGFGSYASGGNSAATLNSAGWPTQDWQCNLLYGGATTLPAWAVGNWSCGFIGPGTPFAYGSASVSNIVYGDGVSTYTTFTMTPTAIGFGIGVTGTGGTASTNIFAYWPTWNSLNTIDYLPTAASIPSSAYDTFAVSHYAQFAFIRNMTMVNALGNLREGTSSNRLTIANTQAPKFGWAGPSFGAVLTTLPGAGVSSLVIENWPYDVNTYGFVCQTASGTKAFIGFVNSTGSNVTVTLTAPLAQALTSTTVYTNAYNQPESFLIGLANATGTCGLWLNLPILEDGSQYTAGTHTLALAQEIANTYTSTGVVKFERGNELWQGDLATSMLNYLSTLYGYSYQGLYLAYAMTRQAAQIKLHLASQFGVTVFNTLPWQPSGNGWSFYGSVLPAIQSTYGTVRNYVHVGAIAPYGNPSFGASDSVATIQSEIVGGITAATFGYYAERIAIQCMIYGLELDAYEYNCVQWNEYSNGSGVPSNGNPNYGAAILNSGYTSALEQFTQAVLNSGFVQIAFFTGGVSLVSGSAAPIDEITTGPNYANINSSPIMSALQSFMSGFTPTRNVVSGSGSVIQGANFADNIAGTLNNNGYNTGSVLYGVGGYCGCIVNCTSPGTYTVVVNWTTTANGITSNLGYAAPGYAQVVSATGVALPNSTTGNTTMGTVVLRQGVNCLILGKATSNQQATVNTVTFN